MGLVTGDLLLRLLLFRFLFSLLCYFLLRPTVNLFLAFNLLLIHCLLLLSLFPFLFRPQILFNLFLGHLSHPQPNLIIPGWLINACSNPDNGLEHMQQFFLIQQFSFLDDILGRLVIRQKILFTDTCYVRVVKVFGDLLLVRYEGFVIVLCLLFLRLCAFLCWGLFWNLRLTLFVLLYRI